MEAKEIFKLYLQDKTGSAEPQLVLENVKKIINDGLIAEIDNKQWFDFLNKSAHPDFLEALHEPKVLTDWANQVFKIIQHSNYSLRDMFEQRVVDIPQHILFQDMSKNQPAFWTYKQVNIHIRQMAAVFYSQIPLDPRVAIFSDNCMESATVDLACLCYDIFDTPISTPKKSLRYWN